MLMQLSLHCLLACYVTLKHLFGRLGFVGATDGSCRCAAQPADGSLGVAAEAGGFCPGMNGTTGSSQGLAQQSNPCTC
jgi:hypothetical protein